MLRVQGLLFTVRLDDLRTQAHASPHVTLRSRNLAAQSLAAERGSWRCVHRRRGSAGPRACGSLARAYVTHSAAPSPTLLLPSAAAHLLELRRCLDLEVHLQKAGGILTRKATWADNSSTQAVSAGTLSHCTSQKSIPAR